MRLTELRPRWMGAGGAGIYNRDPVTGDLVPAPARHGVGILFLCPCPTCLPKQSGVEDEDWYLRHYIPFANPLDGGPPLDANRPIWNRTGETFETLALSPSILSDVNKGGCGWHGYIGGPPSYIAGEVTTL